MDKKKYIAIAFSVLIALNTAIYYNLNSLKRDMENEVRILNAQIAGLYNQLDSQMSTVDQAINKIKEEQKWIGNGSYKLLDFDSASGKVKVEVSWSFRELATDSKVYILYGEKDMASGSLGTWDKAEAAPMDKLNYKGEVYLSPDKDYRVMAQSESSTQSKGGDIMDIDLNILINDRIHLNPVMGMEKGPRYEHHVHVLNNHHGAEPLKIKSAEAKVYVKGSLQNTIKLHKASGSELDDDMIKKFDTDKNNEIWFNDDAVWVNGEENWVKTGENSWTNKGGEVYGPQDVRIEVTIIDNMGKTYIKSYGQGN